MTATYVAWNGKSYPCPPPEGWYLASDGQWWAPGTGPYPLPPSEAPRSSDAPRTVDPSPDEQGNSSNRPIDGDSRPGDGDSKPVDGDSGQVDGADHDLARRPSGDRSTSRAPTTAAGGDHEPATAIPPKFGTWGKPASPARRTSEGGSSTATEGSPATAAPNNAPPTRSSESPTRDTDHGSAAPPPQGELWQQPSKRPKKRNIGLQIAAAVLVLLAVVAVAVMVFGPGSDDSAVDEPPATSSEQATSEPATSDEQQTTTTTTSLQSSTTAPSTTISQTTIASNSDQAITTVPATTSTVAAAPRSTVANPLLVAEYRDRIDDNQLSSEQLSDEQIIEFGTSFCLFAAIAEDGQDFDAYRQAAIADSDGDLTDAELTLAIDLVILVFCPQEAARLGIS